MEHKYQEGEKPKPPNRELEDIPSESGIAKTIPLFAPDEGECNEAYNKEKVRELRIRNRLSKENNSFRKHQIKILLISAIASFSLWVVMLVLIAIFEMTIGKIVLFQTPIAFSIGCLVTITQINKRL